MVCVCVCCTMYINAIVVEVVCTWSCDIITFCLSLTSQTVPTQWKRKRHGIFFFFCHCSRRTSEFFWFCRNDTLRRQTSFPGVWFVRKSIHDTPTKIALLFIAGTHYCCVCCEGGHVLLAGRKYYQQKICSARLIAKPRTIVSGSSKTYFGN